MSTYFENATDKIYKFLKFIQNGGAITSKTTEYVWIDANTARILEYGENLDKIEGLAIKTTQSIDGVESVFYMGVNDGYFNLLNIVEGLTYDEQTLINATHVLKTPSSWKHR